MENDILDCLNDIGYTGPMMDRNALSNAVAGGPKNLDYTKLVNYLTDELRMLCNIDECVNVITDPDESIAFVLELSSFLKELGCPFANLTQGHITDRLSTTNDKLLLLDYLSSELMAARMVAVNKPEQKIELKIQESPMAKDLKDILLALKFSQPPPNITPGILFQKLEPKMQETVKMANPELCGKPIFSGVLTEDMWKRLSAEQEAMNTDYTIRREMLLKRLDCTVQSFQWSDKIKGKEDQIVQVYYNKRKLLKVNPDIDLSDLLAARDDLAIIEKTSNASVRKNTKSSLNKLIIGQVPDRGGRPSEQAPPPPEMPSWQQRSGGGNFSGGGRGGARGRGGGGGFTGNNQQSNYNTQDKPSGGYRGAFNDSRGSYNNSRGGYNDTRGSYNDTRGGYNNNNSRGGNNDVRGGYNDSRGNYDSRGGGGGYNDARGSFNDSRGAYDSGYNNQSRGGGYGRGGGSAGRGYDSFQHTKTTYADQYVQDSQNNQQYSRGGYRGQNRGRSNYNRGNFR